MPRGLLESQFWAMLKPQLLGKRERVENAVNVGTADVYTCYEGTHRWLELKVVDDIQKLWQRIRPEQKVWHDDMAKNGGITFIVTRVNNEVFVHKCSLSGLDLIFRMSKPFDWRKFREIIY